MTVEETKLKKTASEQAILKIIQDLEIESGCIVKNISFIESESLHAKKIKGKVPYNIDGIEITLTL